MNESVSSFETVSCCLPYPTPLKVQGKAASYGTIPPSGKAFE
jgi:hypothetical protein